HSRKITDGRDFGRMRCDSEIAVCDAVRDYAHLLRCEVHSLAHQAGVVLAGCDEGRNVARTLGKYVPAACSPGLIEAVEEAVFALQSTETGGRPLTASESGETNKQRRGEQNGIGLSVRSHPFNQLIQFLRLLAVFAQEHRVRQIADVGTSGLARSTAGDFFQEPPIVENGIQPAWRVAKQWDLLLKENIDAPKEDWRFRGRCRLVERQRKIHRQHYRVVPLSM